MGSKEGRVTSGEQRQWRLELEAGFLSLTQNSPATFPTGCAFSVDET
ncbi:MULTISPECIES: hypothetical protein [unclassified Anabaena]